MTAFEAATHLANAVLMEGYLLYPYRPNTTKNRYRWTFGVVAPRTWSNSGGPEPWWLRTEVIVRQAPDNNSSCVRARLRFLRVEQKRVQRLESAAGVFVDVDELTIDNKRTLFSSEEGIATEVDFEVRGSAVDDEIELAFPSEERSEPLRDSSGQVIGRILWVKEALVGRLIASLQPVDHPMFWRLSVRLENLTPTRTGALASLDLAPRREAVRAAFVSTHFLLACDEGAAFVSLIDPPPEALAAALRCSNVGTHPVLVRDERLILSAPIILGDYPAIAPESPGDFYDSGEIDALLTLRARLLTPDEAALAKANDPRAKEVIERAESLGEDDFARLHGVSFKDEDLTTRAPSLTTTRSNAGTFLPGARVRIRPPTKGRRRTDAQDLLFAGRSATIEAIRHDVDGRTFLAVTFDEDPAAEMHRAKGRFHYYATDEVEAL